VLSEVPDAQTLWLLSTGTGLAPFLSILRTDAPWRRFREVVLVHAVRHARELVYRDMISRLQEQRGSALRYVTFVSREAAPASLAGRIPTAIGDGRLEAALDVRERRDESARDRLMPFMHAERLSVEQRVMLLQGGVPTERGGEICACFGISRATVETAIHKGAESIDAVACATRAGSNCGSCRPEIRALLRGRRALQAA